VQHHLAVLLSENLSKEKIQMSCKACGGRLSFPACLCLSIDSLIVSAVVKRLLALYG